MLSKNKWSEKQETLWVVSGLLAFSLLYYRRTTIASIAGLIVLIITGVFWGYSIRRVHPFGLKEFRLIKDKLGWQVVVGLLITGLWFIAYSGYLYLTRGRGLTLSYGGSPLLLFSVLIVASAEELFFNGYLLTRLRAFSSSPWLRPLIAILVFSLYKVTVHFGEEHTLVYYIELFVLETLSYPASWWAEHSGSLVAPILVHILVDFFMYAHRTAVPPWVF